MDAAGECALKKCIQVRHVSNRWEVEPKDVDVVVIGPPFNTLRLTKQHNFDTNYVLYESNYLQVGLDIFTIISFACKSSVCRDGVKYRFSPKWK